MQRRLKAFLRSSRKKKVQLSNHSDAAGDRTNVQTQAVPPRVPQTSSPQLRNTSQPGLPDHFVHSPGHANPQQLPLDSQQTDSKSAILPAGRRENEAQQADLASDYQSFLPILSPEDEFPEEHYNTLGGDRRVIVGQSEGKHEEDVADRNIEKYGSASQTPKKPSLASTEIHPMPEPSRKISLGANSLNSVASIPSKNSGAKYVVGQDVTTKGGLIDSILPHTETTAHEKDHWKNTEWPLRSARTEAQIGWSKRKPHGLDSDDDEPAHSKKRPVDFKTAIMDGQDETDFQKQLRLDGVVDLRNTVDTDKTTKWAPAVTHEVVKPHEHEIVQHKIYREIHNYTYYHRIQPVIHTEILPARHWVPNPNGEGLVEVSVDQLPANTIASCSWQIIRKDPPPSASVDRIYDAYRTKPEIIEGPTTMTEEGFERRETTIIYPPTRADMSSYTGLVQPMHFDHKTGQRWLGEITSMQNFHKDTQGNPHTEDLSLSELIDSLPQVPQQSSAPQVQKNMSVKRKPVNESFTAPAVQMVRVM